MASSTDRDLMDQRPSRAGGGGLRAGQRKSVANHTKCLSGFIQISVECEVGEQIRTPGLLGGLHSAAEIGDSKNNRAGNNQER